jgi:predicted AAA+ superfamily ATPase
MIPREAASSLRQLAGWYPVVALTGPRQAGKTTLARAVFPDKPYASLEDVDTRAFALADPRRFLGQFPEGAILDEVQRAPELFSYLQTLVDAGGGMGRFILTGSQQFGLTENITQSLAGRVGFLHLLPFTLKETRHLQAGKSLEDVLWQGFYPPLLDRGIPPHVWFSDYLTTYVERDVRLALNIRDLAAFHRFVLMCAARTGQSLNLSALAADCGITHNTAKAWLSVLEASYLVALLPPYHRNLGKRLTKTPKLYFLDTGFAAWLAGVREARELVLGNLRGPLFETLVVAEFMKFKRNHLRPEELYFWRDSAGHEIDLLVEAGDRLLAVECKAGQTVAQDWFAALDRFDALAGPTQGMVIMGGDQGQPRSPFPAISWRELGDAMESSLGTHQSA